MDRIEFTLRGGEDFIRLGQVLKACGLCGSGVEAKEVIQDGEVLVNGETETRRGRKLHAGDEAVFAGQTIVVRGAETDTEHHAD